MSSWQEGPRAGGSLGNLSLRGLFALRSHGQVLTGQFLAMGFETTISVIF